MLTDEDADRIARAQTREKGQLMVRGCGFFLTVLIIGAVIITVLYYIL